MYFLSLIKPNASWSLWNTLHDYTVFNISVTLTPVPLSYTLIILCTFTRTFLKKKPVLPFIFCQLLESTTDISDSLIPLDPVVEFSVGSS